jgi:hypothetical protein
MSDHPFTQLILNIILGVKQPPPCQDIQKEFDACVKRLPDDNCFYHLAILNKCLEEATPLR